VWIRSGIIRTANVVCQGRHRLSAAPPSASERVPKGSPAGSAPVGFYTSVLTGTLRSQLLPGSPRVRPRSQRRHRARGSAQGARGRRGRRRSCHGDGRSTRCTRYRKVGGALRPALHQRRRRARERRPIKKRRHHTASNEAEACRAGVGGRSSPPPPGDSEPGSFRPNPQPSRDSSLASASVRLRLPAARRAARRPSPPSRDERFPPVGQHHHVTRLDDGPPGGVGGT
jgi:hypothetical protein